MSILHADRSLHKVQFPNRKVRVRGPVEQRTSDVLTKNTTIMGSGLISRKSHHPLVQQEMLGYTRSEIAVPMRANADNSWLCSTVSPIFAPLIEKIDSVVRQFGWYERKC